MIANDNVGGWKSAGGNVHGPPVPTPGLEPRVDALPWAKHVDLQCSHHYQRKTDPDHRHIPTALHIGAPEFEEALARFQYHYQIVLGDPSINIIQAHNPHNQKVYDLLMYFGLMELLLHFRKSWRYHNMKTWLRLRKGRAMQSRSDYILGKDRRLFEMVEIRGVRNYLSYNFSLRARLLLFSTATT